MHSMQCCDCINSLFAGLQRVGLCRCGAFAGLPGVRLCRCSAFDGLPGLRFGRCGAFGGLQGLRLGRCGAFGGLQGLLVEFVNQYAWRQAVVFRESCVTGFKQGCPCRLLRNHGIVRADTRPDITQ